MIKQYRFYKDQWGWFIDIPNYPGSKGSLAMVAGADTFLEILAQGEDEVTLNLTTDFIEGYEVLERTQIHSLGLAGADYHIKSYKGIEYNHDMWLCPVTLYVFQRYPSIIYFTVV